MKYLQFLIHSNIWISLGAALLSLLVVKISELTPNYLYISFVFFSTLFSYLFQRIIRLKSISESNPNSWIVKNKKVGVSILIIAFVGAIITVPIFEAPFSLLWIVLLGIISTGYSYRNLRDIPYLKIILISASWGVTCGILPIIMSSSIDKPSEFIHFFWVFLYILAITIPFDIRDIGIDEERKKTIPQWVGVLKSKIVGVFALALSLIYLFFITTWLHFFGFVIGYILAGVLLFKSERTNSNFFFTFWVDGHIITLFLLVYFLG